MSYIMVSNRQLSTSVAMIILSLVAIVYFMKALNNYLDLPEVWMSQGQCVKVVNFKNGDGYTCVDKDVVLRHYVVINSK